MRDNLQALVKKAKGILEANWLGASTKPAQDLYPHQWNWDSGFIANGYARYDQKRAQQELTTLFRAQWKNGMLPQIVFNTDALGGYFPEPDFWHCDRSSNYPDGVETSGITMPPVHATAARIKNDMIRLVRDYGFHEYFDPFKGTAYGTDNFSWTAALFLDVALEEDA